MFCHQKWNSSCFSAILIPVLVLTKLLYTRFQPTNLQESYLLVTPGFSSSHWATLAHKGANKPQKQHKTQSHSYVLSLLTAARSTLLLWGRSGDRHTDIFPQSGAESGMQTHKSTSPSTEFTFGILFLRERKIHHVMDMYSIRIPPMRVIRVHEDILIADAPNTRKYAQQPNRTKNTEELLSCWV